LSTQGWKRETIGDPPLLVFLLIESLKPLYEYVAGTLAACIDEERWMRGFCPICGAIPPIGEITGEQGERTLFCVYCGMDWYYPELRCPFCGGSEQ
jgi:FdhE protein